MQASIQQLKALIRADGMQNSQILARCSDIMQASEKAYAALKGGDLDETARLLQEIRNAATWIDALEGFDVRSTDTKMQLCAKLGGDDERAGGTGTN